MRTQVGIIGSGPAGLLLSQALHKNDIDSIIVEHRDRAHVEGRIRAGVLEQGTVDMLHAVDVGGRLTGQGLVHDGFDLCLDGYRRRVDLRRLTGKSVTIYGQTEITKDLIEARLNAGGVIQFGAADVRVYDYDTDNPHINYSLDGQSRRIDCDFIAGCDGFHGICRDSFPANEIHTYERSYPFAWLGILAEATPPSDELIYVSSDRGFALFSMRSSSLSRNYLQCAPDEDLNNWPDSRVWDELRTRLGPDHAGSIKEGPVLEKSVTQMRSFVAEPMQCGRLFLAGDAAHIVPPTGAKGLNLAVSDVRCLSDAMVRYYRSGDARMLDHYTDNALERVWKAQRFSWWMTSMLHSFDEAGSFQNKIRKAELGYVLSSDAALTSLAENYVGLPF